MVAPVDRDLELDGLGLSHLQVHHFEGCTLLLPHRVLPVLLDGIHGPHSFSEKSDAKCLYEDLLVIKAIDSSKVEGYRTLCLQQRKDALGICVRSQSARHVVGRSQGHNCDGNTAAVHLMNDLPDRTVATAHYDGFNGRIIS